MLSAIFKGIRPAVVALIIAPVLNSAKSAKIGIKTIWIPVVVALLIWSKLPYVSNPILYIILRGAGGYYIMERGLRKAIREKTEEEFGVFYCKDITHLDWGVIMERCPALIAETYMKVMEILTERGIIEV